MKTKQSRRSRPQHGRLPLRATAYATVLAVAAAGLAGQALAGPAGSAAEAADPADVGIVATATPEPAVVGQNLTYTVTITNHGPGRATGVNIRFLVSGRKTSLVSATATQGVCDLGGNRVICRLDRVEPQATAQATIVVNPGLGPTVTAAATVSTGSPDPNTANQQALLTTKVTETNPPTNVHITGTDMAQPFQSSTLIAVKWTGIDTGTGISTFDVRYRRAPLGHGFGRYVAWRSHVTTRGAAFQGAQGSTYCFSVRATDVAGNTSAWSAEQCTAIPIGVASFARHGGWLLLREVGYFGSQYAYSKIKGATLTMPHVVARSLALVASRCTNCGSVTVFWNGKALKTIDLDYPLAAKRQIFTIARFKSVRTGVVQIRLTSTHKRVKVEGLGASRV